jgi:hypothetical protein
MSGSTSRPVAFVLLYARPRAEPLGFNNASPRLRGREHCYGGCSYALTLGDLLFLAPPFRAGN